MEYEKLITNTQSLSELEEIRIKLLGKKGEITQLVKALSELDLESKKEKGKELNILKKSVQSLIDAKKTELTNNNQQKQEIDYAFPFKKEFGRKHIITKSIELLREIFQNIGFQEAHGPDIENVFYNFEALNIPLKHPARDNNDTFYMNENEVLRTHITPVQARILESLNSKNTRSYSIGRAYRNDDHDATHASMFHQIEGIIVEDDVTIQHLKGFLENLLAQFFEKKIKIHFRPSFFPFTEPSFEVDIFTQIVNGKLQVAESGKPLELGGCGVIHPNILKRFNYPQDKQTFAFGMGLERLLMIKHGITNIHTFYNNKIDELQYEINK